MNVTKQLDGNKFDRFW